MDLDIFTMDPKITSKMHHSARIIFSYEQLPEGFKYIKELESDQIILRNPPIIEE